MKRDVFAAAGLLFFACLVVLVSAGTFSDVSSANFSGVYNRTYYNSTGFLSLNETIPGNSTSYSITVNATNATEMTGGESGLVAYWRFNESSWSGTAGEVKDVLGKYNGTAKTGAAVNTTGLPGWGNAANFNGTMGTYVNEIQVASASGLNPQNNSFTLTGWAKSYQRTGSAFQVYVAKRDNVAGGKNGYYLGLLEGSGLNFAVGDGTTRNDTRNNNSAGTSYVNVAYGQWFHFAGVVDRGTNKIYLYVNGTLGSVASIASIGNISNTWNLSIGDDEGQGLQGAATQYPVKGNVDELAVWNRALNSTEIFSLYQKGNYSAGNTTTTTNSTNSTEFYSGTYESPSKDAGAIVQWGNISWSEEVPYGEEISADSGNVLLVHLNEASGNLNDSSGLGNNGRVYGATYGATGKFENALSFDGSNDFADFGNAASLRITGNVTLSQWVKFNQIPTGTTVYATLDKNEAGGYGIIANEQIAGGLGRLVTYFHVGGAYKNVGVNLTSLSAGVWYHVAATYNGTGVAFYLNGNLTESVAASGSITDVASYNLTIGANPGPAYNEFFNGMIDEVGVWNRSLSSSEILNMYKRGMNLRFQARTSNDNAVWSNYGGVSGDGSYYTSPGQALNLSNSRYVQYKAFFDRNSTIQNIKLYNVSLDYSELSAGTTVVLDSPNDNIVTNAFNINVTCSASSSAGLANMTPYYDKFDWGPSEPARTVTGTSNSTIFTLGEITTTVKWNCYACNVNGNCSFASANRTIILDSTAPEISLTSPANGQVINNTRTPSFVFSATDSRAATVSCNLMINNSGSVTAGGSNSSVNGAANITSTSLNNGNYTWWINCSDGLNAVESEKRTITINYTNTVVWAKTQTHMHTTASDGTSTLAQVVSNYSSRNYNVLLITNHNVVESCSSYTNLSNNFLCINSEEWTPGSGAIKHVIRANVSSHVATGTSTDAEVQNAMNTAKNEGGFAIAAHPNWSSTIWSSASLASFQNYSIMEIYNGVIERLTPSPYAIIKWDDVLLTGKTMYGIASDDMHIISSDFDKGWSKVYMSEFTKEAYMNSMMTGYFYSSQGPSMDTAPFTLTCDGAASYHMGQSANCSEVSVSATISATNSSFKVQNVTLVKNGVAVYRNTSCPNSQDCAFSYSENVSASGYYRLEATDSNNKQIWSNPIWVVKVLPPVHITINSPLNGTTTTRHFPAFNVSLDRVADTLWFRHSTVNVTLCTNCSSYYGIGGNMAEGVKTLTVYANQSNGDIYSATSSYTISFNRTYEDSFEDNFSIGSLATATWSSGKISLAANESIGNAIIKSMTTANNITSLRIEWVGNNTESAMGEGQINPIRAYYRFGAASWTEISNGTSADGFNSNNLSIKFEFDKNNETPIDLLSFRLTWNEYGVPLISNVSASSITSSSAIISWETDVNSNSTVYYGTSSSLGQAISANDDTRVHSMTLSGLDASTAYFYKVESCYSGSCLQNPQSPYTPYSFTTQATQTSSGSGGGGGGGGSRTVRNTTIIPIVNTTVGEGIVFGVANIEIEGASAVLANPGESKKMSVNVKNSGTAYLNKCKLVGSGELASWITADGAADLSIGQRMEFLFSLDVPKTAAPGNYKAGFSIECQEMTKNSSIDIEIIQKKLDIKMISATRLKDGGLKIVYSLKELAGEAQEIDVQIVLVGSKGLRIAEVSEKRVVQANSEEVFESILALPKDVEEGNLNLLMNANSKIASAFVQEYVLLERISMSGFNVLDVTGGGSLVSAALVLAFLVFSFFIARRILRYRGMNSRGNILSAMVGGIMNQKRSFENRTHYHGE